MPIQLCFIMNKKIHQIIDFKNAKNNESAKRRIINLRKKRNK